MPFSFNEGEIRKTLTTIKPNNALFEIRLISGRWNASGYFHDADTFLSELRKVRIRDNTNAYLLLNEISNDCGSRLQANRFIENATPTTGDGDVTALRWIMVDLDPKRTSGVSSSDEQIELAHDRAQTIFSFLKNRGWQDPIIGMSGNGYHLLYSIAMKNEPSNVALVQNVLKTLDMLFSDDAIEVDTATFNPARICKLYGTMAQKGSDTEKRPHRMSYIVYMPESINPTSSTLLDSLTKLLPQAEAPQRYNNYNPHTFDLQEWIDRYNLRYKEKSSWQGGTKWILEECPFNSEHRGKDASIVQTADGKICFHCFHNSCADKQWKDLRILFEPEAYERNRNVPLAVPNYLQEMKKKMERNIFEDANSAPKFYTTEQIRTMEVPEMEFLPSGITVLDKKMRGLKKGAVSLISGLRASGKSSLISQIALACREKDMKTAIYSGELTCKNLLSWLVIQAAGKPNTHVSPIYENYYYPNDGIEEEVSKWLNDYVYVYNNDYGNDFCNVIEDLEDCVSRHSVDMVILDNLMALDIKSLDSDKYAAQSDFVQRLKRFAVENNVHVMFVAHPRKAMGFLRLDDISGSADLANAVDNAFIVHRVNEDFKRLSKQMFKWAKDKEDLLYNATNVIEICKDRDGGTQDEFIPLYYQVESKRLRNYINEEYPYGWTGEGVLHEVKFTEAPQAEIPDDW